ncbi:MAG: response regulator [Gammaproteobacteria bacterium]
MSIDRALDLPNLLLVDDDKIFTATLSRSLQRKGYRVNTTGTEQETLTLLELSTDALILLDLNLDGESGLKLLPQILQQQPDARVVMLTAYASVATAVDAIKRGADNYLCKPITTTDIISLLQDKDTVEEVPPVNQKPLSVDRLEWEHLQHVLMKHDGNISATARALNMHRRTLQRKLQKRPAAE